MTKKNLVIEGNKQICKILFKTNCSYCEVKKTKQKQEWVNTDVNSASVDSCGVKHVGTGEYFLMLFSVNSKPFLSVLGSES